MKIAEENELEETVETIIDTILKNGPEAIADTKRIIFETEHLNVDDKRALNLAVDHSRKRCTSEAVEGLTSFLEKREASWYPKV